jgi:hypothetical protein
MKGIWFFCTAAVSSPRNDASMELVKIAWIVIFLFFSLTLIFIWSKMYIISRKIKTIDALITQCESVSGKGAAERDQKTPQ